MSPLITSPGPPRMRGLIIKFDGQGRVGCRKIGFNRLLLTGSWDLATTILNWLWSPTYSWGKLYQAKPERTKYPEPQSRL